MSTEVTSEATDLAGAFIHLVPVLALVVIAAMSVVLAIISLIIRQRLRRGRRSDGRRRDATTVNGKVLWSNLRYVAEGPVAEFVIIFSTIAFVAMLFWTALKLSG